MDSFYLRGVYYIGSDFSQNVCVHLMYINRDRGMELYDKIS